MELAKQQVVVTCIHNPFKPRESRDLHFMDWSSDLSARDYMEEFFPEPVEGLEIVASINGAVLSDFDVALRPRDSLAFCAVPESGDDGKAVLRVIATVVVAVVAWYAASAISAAGGIVAETVGTVGAHILGGLASTAITYAGGELINAVFPAQQSDLPALGGMGESNTYGWGVAQNQYAEGRAIPVLYGSFRITPQIITSHISLAGNKQYMNILYALAEGPVSNLTGVKVNDTPVGTYKGLETWFLNGDNDQPVIPSFNDTVGERPVGTKLSTSWIEARTSGDGVTGIGVGLSFPRGLFVVHPDKGYKSPTNVWVSIEYRKVGETEWQKYPLIKSVPYREGFKRSAGVTDTLLTASSETVVNRITASWKISYISDGQIKYWYYTRTYSVGFHFTYSSGTITWIYGPNAGVSCIAYGNNFVYGDINISGQIAKPFRRFYKITGLPVGQYDVRVQHPVAPAVYFDTFFNETWFEYLHEIVEDDFTYPNVALLGLKALATDQLSGGMPRVTGIAERATVEVYNPAIAAYETKSARNPAWICWDILTHKRYGGGIDVGRMDYDAFASWAEFCEAEGFFADLYLDTAMSLAKALTMAATIGRGTVVQQGTNFSVIVDRPAGITQVFTVGNIIQDTFSESFLSIEDRANVVEVTYYDAEKDYARQIVEIRSEDFDTEDLEINKSQVTLYGCTSRDQAIKHGKFLLLCNKYLTRTVTFEADIDAIACQMGDLIRVQHDVPQWGVGGRVVSAAATQVRLDKQVTLLPGAEYRVLVRHQDDDSLEERTVDPVLVESTLDLLAITSPWTNIPAPDAIYTFGEVNLTSKRFRVLAVTRGHDQRRKITAVEHFDELYAAAGGPVLLPEVSTLVTVSDLLAVEGVRFGSGGREYSIISLAWRGVALSWNVYMMGEDESWQFLGSTTRPEFSIETGLDNGQSYEISVTAGEDPDRGEKATVLILGRAAAPADVANFTAQQSGEAVLMTWDVVNDADLEGYEIRQGQAWETATTIVHKATDNRATWLPPLSGTYNLLIKALDQSGNYSNTAAPTTITVDVEGALNVVVSESEITKVSPADGTHDHTVFIPTPNPRISFIPSLTDMDVPDWTDVTIAELESYTGDSPMVFSYTTLVKDLGRIAPVTLRLGAGCDSLINGISITDQDISGRTDLTYPADTDTNITGNIENILNFRTSEDNVVWSDWQVAAGPINRKFRYYQYRTDGSIDITGSKVDCTELKAIVDAADVDHRLYSQPIEATGTTYTLAGLGLEFWGDYSVGVTIQGAAAAYPTVDKLADQFMVHIFNNAGSGIAATADLHIRGF